MESYYVYKHTAPSGKSYIGITSNNPLYRWQNGLGYTGQPKFYKAIKKYGWDNISHEILEEGLTKEQACEKEIAYIKQYDSFKSKDQKYCCQKCEWDSLKVKRKTFVCMSCGKEFVGHRSINKDYKAKFCCIQCRVNWQKRNMTG